jgi:isopenicillin N synthase-like dioxygenase
VTNEFRGEFSDIPIIDLAPLTEPRGRADTVAQLRDALERIGFVYVGGHGIPEAMVETIKALNQKFHALPMEAKRAVAINDFHRGYIPFSSSTIITSSVANVTRPNQSESLMVLHELAPDDADLVARRPLQGPNQWPREIPEMRAMVLDYMEHMTGLGLVLAGAIAEALDLPHDWFVPHFVRPTLWLRLLHYPVQADEPELYGSAPHTDYGFITLLAQDAVGGLEVRNRRGEWIPARPIPGTFVMNVGDILARWSNGRFASTPHRVRNLAGVDRYSMAFFMDPSMDSIIECPPTVAPAGEAPRFAPVRFGDYVMERINKNYDYRRKAS